MVVLSSKRQGLIISLIIYIHHLFQQLNLFYLFFHPFSTPSTPSILSATPLSLSATPLPLSATPLPLSAPPLPLSAPPSPLSAPPSPLSAPPSILLLYIERYH